ncbi:hypothetical protein PPERSA_04323 [Pseudocohnilembus persalinus]|uniref:Transmembrane protein n=1 Tax=Pseudocohnilembus persalinus TaxID=266149 RepID=A0A0V0QQM3_PSEPJ|nr:hypothetical protein PPERSA_04323 [Pseudocohnilembus persalinus]|eukprot:KRX04508.1 hypothetical protein PPERSA_04323 [Pseudocohnilembus persalinus]
MNNSGDLNKIINTEDENLQNIQNQPKKYNMNLCCCCIPIKIVLIIFFIISIAEFILSLIYHHYIGLIFSIILLIIGSLEFLTVIGKIKQVKQNLKFYYILRVVFITIAVFVSIFVIIRFASLSNAFSDTAFPITCPENSKKCVRVAQNNSYRNKDLQPMLISTSKNQMQEFTEKYIDDQSGMWVVNSENQDDQNENCFVFSRYVTTFWGFINDFSVDFCCQNGQSLVQTQCMSVLGSDDFNVNYDITEDFYKYLEKNKGQLKDETC